uniref:Uncharacterized protein n=1 Tax=Hucho hucho TaxID=62062 RepID=A0A4W5NXC4_9TELE
MVGLSSAIQNGFRKTFGRGRSERQYLTTVIPYEKKGGPPSVEDLQILTQSKWHLSKWHLSGAEHLSPTHHMNLE